MSYIAQRNPDWGRSCTDSFRSRRSLPQNIVIAAGLLFFIFAWTSFASITMADRALHWDVLEAYAWGKEFQLGYNQHPPFWAWLAGLWFLVFPHEDVCFHLLEALNAALGLLGAWRLIGLFATGPARHAAALLLVTTPCYTFLSFKYNADTIFLSLWPWTLFFFIISLDNMKLRDAMLFGLFAGLSMLSKYYSIILLMSCAMSLVFHPNGRKYLLSPLPWIAGVIFAALVLPHAIWSLTAAAPPAAYAMGLTGKGWLFSISYAGGFLRDSVANFSGVAAIIFVSWRASRSGDVSAAADPMPQSRRRFLAVLVLSPILLTVMFALCFQLKIKAIMAVGTFPLMPLFLMQFAPRLDGRHCFRLAGIAAIAVTAIAAATAPLTRSIIARKSDGPTFEGPRRELAQRVTSLWHDETHTPLRFAGAEARYAFGLSFYSEDRPSAFVNLSYAMSGWVTPAKLKQYGLLIACVHEDAICHDRAAGLLWGNWKQTSIRVGREIGARKIPDVMFDIFIVPPQAGSLKSLGAGPEDRS
jgi:4-amino-4-deoxy-L-arabinose transferase-like glycosyltransferase